MTFTDYIHSVMKNGKCTFSIEDAKSKLHKSKKAILASIGRLLKKGELASPAKGFYVIVPPEYQILGCIPAEYFIPYLMEYWHIDYYACLLTAATYHGASHQAVMVFQVMINKPRPPIICGKIKINFITNKKLSNTPTQKIATRMSLLKISTPEGTAMDLLNYPHQSGGLNHIVTVLTELGEGINSNHLLKLAENSATLPWQQRLGFIFEKLNAHELAKILNKNLLKQKRIDYIPLAASAKIKKNATKNAAWKIIENYKLEGDL